LAEKCSFEEVAYLVLNSDLPNRSQLDEFTAALRHERALPGGVYDVLKLLPRGCHPMDALKVGAAVLGQLDAETCENTHDANMRKAVRIIARMPALVANSYRIVEENRPPVAPDLSLPMAADFLHMLHDRRPNDLESNALNASLVVYAEHGYNASTFAARVTVSTQSDVYSGLVSAMGALKGNLHGGANEEAMEMLLEIGSVDHAKQYVQDALAAKRKIMGFGHREYRTSDSRTPIITELGRRVSEKLGNMKWYELAAAVEKEMWDAKKLFANVDFPSGWVYYLLGLPIPIYTPIFAMARSVGWSAHMIEQLDNNRIIRPTSIYEGDLGREFVALEKRG
jgi:citrate synthase